MLVGVAVGWRDSIIRTGGPSHRSCFLQSFHLLLGFRFLASTSTHNPWTDPSNRVSLSWEKASRLWSLSFFGLEHEQKVVYVWRLFSHRGSWVSCVCLCRCRQARLWKALSHILLGSAVQRQQKQQQQHCGAPATDLWPLDVWGRKQQRETKDRQRTNSLVTDWWFQFQQRCSRQVRHHLKQSFNG